jgi:hypothetical protein
MAEELGTGATPLLLVSDTVAAAEHAASLGLIHPNALAEIRVDKARDVPPSPREALQELQERMRGERQ